MIHHSGDDSVVMLIVIYNDTGCPGNRNIATSNNKLDYHRYSVGKETKKLHLQLKLSYHELDLSKKTCQGDQISGVI